MIGKSGRAWNTVLWVTLGVGLGYWLLWALFAPVLKTDSLTFNLARLWVLERGGLFHNVACTWDRMLTAPLAFDATHYPFLRLGGGYGLPSFLCLVGLLTTAYHLVPTGGGTSGKLIAALGFLGMPMMVYQGVNTKNDLVVAFGLLVWFHALGRARAVSGEDRGRPAARLHLTMAALALGLIVGAKASGMAFGLLAAVGSFVCLWRDDRGGQAAWFAKVMAISLLLFGDGEILVANRLRHHHWLGVATDVEAHRNTDGLAGGAANLMRYACDLSDPFFLDGQGRTAFIRWKREQISRGLKAVGFEGSGFMHMPWKPLGEDDFRSVGTVSYTENNATFGCLGALAMWGTLGIFLRAVWRRRWDQAAVLATVAIVSLWLLAWTVGWSAANARYLVAPFTFAWCALIVRVCEKPGYPWLKACLGALIVGSAWMTIAVAVSKPPGRLLTALRHPHDLSSAREKQFVPELERLASVGALPVLLWSGTRTWLFDVYDRLRDNVVVLPDLNPATLADIDRRYRKGRYIVLALSRDVPPAAGLQMQRRLTLDKSGRDSGFFLWTAPGAGPSSTGGGDPSSDSHP